MIKLVIVSIAITICIYLFVYVFFTIKYSKLCKILERRYPDILKKYETVDARYLPKISIYSTISVLMGLKEVYFYKLIYSTELAAVRDQDIQGTTKTIKILLLGELFLGAIIVILIAIPLLLK